MALNMKTLTQALAKTAAVIEKTVQTTVQEVTGPRALQDYEILDQVGSGGPGLAWKLFSARPRAAKPSQAQYPFVCVWLLDKKALTDARTRSGLSKAAEDAFLDVIRADAARLVRLRHPGVVHVVQALDESKTAMAMVTEPLFASVANALGKFDNVSKVPSDLKVLEMGILEIKHGLLQVSESLDFLHTNARLIHRAISPEAVFITSGGSWKLGGFGFAIPMDQNAGDSTALHTFHYAEYDIEDSVLPLQPSLNYTAPELVRSREIQTGCSADIFSFGCLIYHLLAHKPLLDCNNNVKMYTNRLMHLSHDFSSIPRELISDLQRMLAVDSLSRPTAMDFTGSPFFRDDTRLRALRFLDHMLERDNMQKSEFLKALSEMWKDFGSRVLRYKVLPPLCAELRNMVMQPMILPMVLTIAESQDKTEFELSTLPALVPVLASAAGETLLLLVKHAELIISKASHEHLIAHVLPLLVRAYDDTDVRIQEEVLRRTVCLAKQLDGQLVNQAILPRVHGLALKTTVAAVRVNALLCLADLIPSLDKHACLDILQTLQRCTAVDRSAPTLMCTLGVANSLVKQYGIEFAAEHALPLLMPLLTAQQLNVQQFGKFMLFVKDVLRRIEEKRGVTVNDSGVSDVSLKHSGANGHLSEPLKKPSGNLSSSTKSTNAWDEDWGSIAKRSISVNHAQEPSLPPKAAATPASQPIPVHSTQFLSASAPDPHVSASCPAVDIEWPRLAPSSSHGWQMIDNEKQISTSQVSGNPSFDDIDPFADWPPRTGNAVNHSLNSNINSGMLMPLGGRPATNASSPANLYLNNPIDLSKLQQQIPSFTKTTSTSGFSMNSSVALSKLNRGGQVIAGTPMSKTEDLATMLVSAKSEQPTAPRLAPPPPAGKIGGRGRQHKPSNSASLSSTRNTRTSSEQPPLLDLL